jgi:hypothetical protein
MSLLYLYFILCFCLHIALKKGGGVYRTSHEEIIFIYIVYDQVFYDEDKVMIYLSILGPINKLNLITIIFLQDIRGNKKRGGCSAYIYIYIYI